MSPWPSSHHAAVTLSYDDGIPSHHQYVAPTLEEHGLRATFYVPARALVDADIAAWRLVADVGHELGNHSCFHPCRQEGDGYGWLADHYDLRDYTLDRLRDEWRVASLVLKLIDGKTERTYGNTCCHTTVGRGDRETAMDPVINELFLAGRGPINHKVAIPGPALSLARVGHYSGDSKSFDQLRREVENARKQGGWIFYMFHGVGHGTHSLFIESEEHRQFVAWLGQQTDIWTAPAVDVARHLRQSGFGAS